MNEQIKQELIWYRRIFIRGLLGLSLVWIVAMLLLASRPPWPTHLWGFFIGVFFASLNLVALAFSFVWISILERSRRAVWWPIITFITMCVATGALAFYYEKLLLGFAVGLCVPLLFGSLIAFGGRNPLDQRS